MKVHATKHLIITESTDSYNDASGKPDHNVLNINAKAFGNKEVAEKVLLALRDVLRWANENEKPFDFNLVYVETVKTRGDEKNDQDTTA